MFVFILNFHLYMYVLEYHYYKLKHVQQKAFEVPVYRDGYFIG